MSALVPQQETVVMVPREKYRLVRDMYAVGCSENEFAVFLELANKYQLDPFARQIWCVKYGSKPASVFISVDGMVAIAHRSGQLDGITTDVVFAKDEVTPIRARCEVRRKDASYPFVGEAYMSEDNQKQGVWLQRPTTMLRKVAMVRALRQAFPVSGLYAPEEMPDQPEPVRVERREDDITVQPVQQPAAPATPSADDAYAPDCDRIYSQEQFDTVVSNIRNMGGCADGLQTRARMRNGFYNADIVNAAFAEEKKKCDAKKQQAPAATPSAEPKQQETKPAAEKSVCPNCGKPSMTRNDVRILSTVLEGTGVTFDERICRECAQKIVDQRRQTRGA